VQGLTRGDLRLAMTPSLTASLIGPLVENFNARYSRINLSVTEMNRDRVETLLAQPDDARYPFVSSKRNRSCC